MCCHTETAVANQSCSLTQSQCTDTRPTNPWADPLTPGVWKGSYWRSNIFKSLHWYDSTWKKFTAKEELNPDLLPSWRTSYLLANGMTRPGKNSRQKRNRTQICCPHGGRRTSRPTRRVRRSPPLICIIILRMLVMLGLQGQAMKR